MTVAQMMKRCTSAFHFSSVRCFDVTIFKKNQHQQETLMRLLLTKGGLAAALIIAMPNAGASANDNNRNLAGYPAAAPVSQSGVGARAEIMIPLSSGLPVRREDSWRLEFSAGPQLSWASTRDGRKHHRLAPLMQFSLRSQHSSRFSIAGNDVFTRWAPSISAAERNTGEKGSGITTAGWLGIAFGAAAVVGGVLLLADSETCYTNPIGCDGPNCPPPPC